MTINVYAHRIHASNGRRPVGDNTTAISQQISVLNAAYARGFSFSLVSTDDANNTPWYSVHGRCLAQRR